MPRKPRAGRDRPVEPAPRDPHTFTGRLTVYQTREDPSAYVHFFLFVALGQAGAFMLVNALSGPGTEPTDLIMLSGMGVWIASVVLLVLLRSALMYTVRRWRRMLPFSGETDVRADAAGLSIHGMGVVPWTQITRFGETGDENGLVVVGTTGYYNLLLNVPHHEQTTHLVQVMGVHHAAQRAAPDHNPVSPSR